MDTYNFDYGATSTLPVTDLQNKVVYYIIYGKRPDGSVIQILITKSFGERINKAHDGACIRGSTLRGGLITIARSDCCITQAVDYETKGQIITVKKELFPFGYPRTDSQGRRILPMPAPKDSPEELAEYHKILKEILEEV